MRQVAGNKRHKELKRGEGNLIKKKKMGVVTAQWVMMFWKCLDALNSRNCFILSYSESDKKWENSHMTALILQGG